MMKRVNFQRLLSVIAVLAILCSLLAVGGSLTAHAANKDITLSLRMVSNGGATLYIDPVANVENRYYKMAITVDGAQRNVSIKLNSADADYFLISPYSFNRYDSSLSTAPTSSFEIAAGTQLIPMGVNDPFTEHPEVDAVTVTNALKVVNTNGTWAEEKVSVSKTYTEIPADTIAYYETQESYFSLNTTTTGLPKANGMSYWGSYAGTITVLVNGEETSATVGNGGKDGRLFLYLTADVVAAAETVVIPDGAQVDLTNGDPGIKIVGDFKMYKDGDAWLLGEKPVAKTYTEIPADTITYYETQESYFSLNTTTTGLPKANGTSYWGSYAGTITVLVNGEETSATVGNGGKDGRLFLYLTADVVAAAETVVIPDGAQVDLTNGDPGIQFVGDFKMYKAANSWYVGEKPQVDYTDIDASKLTLHANGVGYNAANGQSYIYLTLPVELPVSANYSIFTGNTGLTVTATDAKGNEVPVTGAYFSSIDADKKTTMLLYLQPGTDWFAEYTKIVVKAQNELVNQKDPTTGINLLGDLELIYNETLGWGVGERKTPTTICEVGVSFASATGAELRLNAILPDGKKIMEIYGDWSTALGAITVGAYDDNGELVETVISSTRYSMAGGYFILYGLDLNNIETITVKAGTYLAPTANCKSDVPLKIVNTLKLARNEEDEFVAVESVTPSFGKPESSPVTGDTDNTPFVAVLVLAIAVLVAVRFVPRRLAK